MHLLKILKVSLISLFLFTYYTSASQTTISTNISTNSTWEKSNSPFVIESYIEVDVGVSLTIEPGVVVKLQEFASVNVQGTVLAQGTEQERIVFTSFSDDEYSGDTNGDGDISEPYPGEWLSISLASNSGNSNISHCVFRYGGSLLEIGALDVYTPLGSLNNIEFNNCSLGLNISTSTPVNLSDLSFLDNDSGLLNTSQSTVSVNNSSFVNNTDGGLINFSTLEMDATLNYWGIEDYLLGYDNDTSNLQSIVDESDFAFYGKVLYFPMLPPPLTIESISPTRSTLTSGGATLTVLGFLYDSESMLYLEKGDQIITPETIVSVDSFSIQAAFSWASAETGLYDVVVINPGEDDTLRLESGFSLLDVDLIPFGEWIEFNVSSGTSYASAVNIPDSIDNVFVLVKKSTRIGYSSTWDGLLKVNYGDGSFEIDDGFFSIGYDVGTDMNFQIIEPESDLYTFEMETIAEQGSGQIIFTDSLPHLSLGQWSSGEILRPYGHDWKVVEVPPGQSDLFISTEGFGLWSTIEVFHDKLIGSSQRWLFNGGAGFQINGHIENPPPGKYYIRYTDSAVLLSSSPSPYAPQNQFREYLIQVSTVPISGTNLPLSVTGLSTVTVGQGIASLDVYGSGFTETDSIYISNGGSQIGAYQKSLDTVNNIWNVKLELSQASEGEWDVFVDNGVEIVNSPDRLTIEAEEEYDLGVKLITSSQIRAGRWRPVIVEVTNYSNIDAYLVPVAVSFDGTPKIENDLLSDFPDEITEEVQGDDWDLFGEDYNSWEDVEIYFDFPDSMNNTNTRVVPFFFQRIKANSTERLTLNVFYETQGDSEIKVNMLPPSIINSDGAEIRSLDNCVNAFGDLVLAVASFSYAGGLESCLGPLSTLTSSGSNVTSGTARNIAFAARIGGCTGLVLTAAGAATANPALLTAGKVIGAMSDLASGGVAVNNIYENCGDLYPDPDPLNNNNNSASTQINVVGSTTPEDKYGIVGAEQEENLPMEERQNYINTTDNFGYRIDYWNKEDASAPAAEVFIRDTLDENFDLTTFSFTEIGFLRWSVPLEGGHYFNVTVDMRPDENYFVNVEGTLNPFTREVYWVHRTYDAETLEIPSDPFAGYLPPIDPDGYNIGWVSFTVEPGEGLPSESVFQNQAHVNFDGIGPWGPAPPYGPYTNTYDFDAPESSVMPLDNINMDTSFVVSWSGQDGDGAGIGYYDIYVAEDNGDYEIWKFNTKTVTDTFTGEFGSTYRFFSIATDKVGNVELPSNEEDASTEIITSVSNLDAKGYYLFQNTPNPFSKSTTFRFQTPESASALLELITVDGTSTPIINKTFGAGEHIVNWKPDEALPRGIYFYRLTTSKYSKTLKLIIH